MIVDSSAIIAILLDEPEAADFAQTIGEAEPAMSAASYFEASIIADRGPGLANGARFDEIIETLRIAIEPVTVAQARIARQAYRAFGKGSGHPAGLNFGDCFAYALAIDKRRPLLFKGADFVHTDVKRAL